MQLTVISIKEGGLLHWKLIQKSMYETDAVQELWWRWILSAVNTCKKGGRKKRQQSYNSCLFGPDQTAQVEKNKSFVSVWF